MRVFNDSAPPRRRSRPRLRGATSSCGAAAPPRAGPETRTSFSDAAGPRSSSRGGRAASCRRVAAACRRSAAEEATTPAASRCRPRATRPRRLSRSVSGGSGRGGRSGIGLVLLTAWEQMNKNIAVVAEAAAYAREAGRTFVEPVYCRSRVRPPFDGPEVVGAAFARCGVRPRAPAARRDFLSELNPFISKRDYLSGVGPRSEQKTPCHLPPPWQLAA